MSRYEDRQAVAGKIATEGGMAKALEYGIDLEDMPEGDFELYCAWEEMARAWELYQEAAFMVDGLLPDGE